MTNNRTVVIFGAFDIEPSNKEYQRVVSLSSSLASCGFNICTGGYQGMMEAASYGAFLGKKSNTIKIIGVTVDKFISRVPNKYINHEIKCKDLFERLQKFYEIGDAFIICRGAIGTLNELFLFWVLKYQGFLGNRPVIFFGDFWNDFIQTLQGLEVNKNHFDLIKIYNNEEDIINILEV
jgi:predicted Rossmann-fold nucleotide-binding protein